MGTFVADFETTTNLEDCRVWAYALCEVGNESNTIVGTTIDDFMKWCKDSKENHKIFFHNLKFDGQFIMSYLFRNGYVHTTEQEDRATNTFNTLITNDGLYYQIEVIFVKKGKRVNKVTFQDSLKLIPLSVDEIAKAFKMDICKLKIDYSSHNNLPIGSSLTFDEEEYIKHDVKIVARAIDYFYSQGLNKMTIGSCALNEYKELIFKKNFKRYFPLPKVDYHNDVKQSYRGGFTYLNPKFKEKTVGKGLVLDVNSLYPSVMYDSLLPFGIPIFFKGKYEYDNIYPLYTQMIRCSFKLKKGKIPTIQIKHCYDFVSNEYLESSNDLEVVLCLNSVDLKLFLEHYNVYNLEYISGWKFKATQGLFTDYIDKWSNNKINAKKEGNHGLYLISKLFLNETKIVILVYSIDNGESFKELNYWYDLYKELLGEKTILGIAGNKMDLYLNQEVEEEKAKEFAESRGAIFSLVSAKDNKESIDNFITKLVKAYLNKDNPKDEDNNNNEKGNTIKLDEKNLGGNAQGENGCCSGKKKNK